MAKERILSGNRPTGKLHLGHLHGALKNWVKLQDNYECFYFVADWHALTTEYSNTKIIRNSINDMVVDWICAGLDPQRSVIFVQSKVKEHAELHLLLSMLTPLSWVENCPTFREQLKELANKEINTYGFLGYPVLQTADILIYKANKVPVGVDQLPHIEMSREIARRFNKLYKNVFPEPEPLLTESPKLLGFDNRKMSKSYDNAIYLSDPEGEIRKKVMMMITDPQRKLRSDPGNPDVCNVFTFHKLYSSMEYVDMVNRDCRLAKIGCVEDKKALADRIIEDLRPFQARRAEILSKPAYVDEILEKGNARAKSIAEKTMEEVRGAIGV